MALFLFWAARDGGFDPLRWLPGAIFLMALIVVALIAGPRRPMPRAVIVSLAGLAGFTLWSYASLAWAGVPSDAWIGANRTLLYLCVFVLFVLFPWRSEAAALLVGAFSFGVGAIGLIELARVAAADDPTNWFIGGRLASPIAYSNANTALYLIAFFPALYLAAQRGVHPVVRGLLLSSAGVCMQLALLSQSRASLGAFPLTLAVYFLLVPSRLRSLAVLVPVALATLATARPVLDIYSSAVAGEGVHIAAEDVRTAVFASAVSLFVVGTILGLADRRLRLRPTTVRRVGVVVLSVLVLTVMGSAVAGLARYGNPVDEVPDWSYHDFTTTTEETYRPDVAHLAIGFGGGRYGLWRIAWQRFTQHPLQGIGVDNFAVDNLRLRREINDSDYPHSLELRVVSQTGLIGSALFLTFLIAALVAVSSSLRRGVQRLARARRSCARRVRLLGRPRVWGLVLGGSCAGGPGAGHARHRHASRGAADLRARVGGAVQLPPLRPWLRWWRASPWSRNGWPRGISTMRCVAGVRTPRQHSIVSIARAGSIP